MKFKKEVYKLVRKIPKGKITTYGEIARALRTRAYRHIGKILKENRDKKVPCHRVVLSNGKVGGYNRGINTKIKLLRKEGIRVVNKKIIDFKSRFYKFN